VECEFSDAGCDAKVYRKDLPSHLQENMVAHMSLLARENRKLRLQLRNQGENHAREKERLKLQVREQDEIHAREKRELKLRLREQATENREDQGKAHEILNKEVQRQRTFLSHVPPLDLFWNMETFKKGDFCLSEPFYSHIGGYKLQLELHCVGLVGCKSKYKYRYSLLDSESAFPPSETLHITAHIIQQSGNVLDTRRDVVSFRKKNTEFSFFQVPVFHCNKFHLSQIEIHHTYF
jgi:hypothetical protein